jgi:hypothetical protein
MYCATCFGIAQHQVGQEHRVGYLPAADTFGDLSPKPKDRME